MDILNFLKELIVTLGILMSMIFVPAPSANYEAKNPDEVKLVINAVSDVHIETNNSSSYKNFEKLLRGMKANTSADASVFLGDNTMNGQITENALFFGGVKAMLNSKNTFVALGNHDIGNGEGDYEKNYNRFKSYNNMYMKNKIDTPYFYRVVKDTYMIFLGTEDITVNSMYISETQINWLKDTLQKAKESGNPIFVFAHHPEMSIEGGNWDTLLKIFDEYENLYYIHGHTHTNYRVYKNGNTVCVNLPRVTETVDYAPGTGLVIEVYDNEVLLRERDFCTGNWLSEASF